jgi:hypothetical protein
MPKRVIDFDALWGSDKLAACAEWAQAEYAWLYGLADASGSFELTNLRVIWGRVAAIRKNLTLERLQEIFDEFIARGLLFAWEENGKRYGHWTGSDVPGRLPAPSWRARLEKLAPPVPAEALAAYSARFGGSKEGIVRRASVAANATGREPAFAGNATQEPDSRPRGINPAFEATQGELKQDLEEPQGQDWDLASDLEENLKKKWEKDDPACRSAAKSVFAQATPEELLEIYEQERGELPRAVAMTRERRRRCARCLASGVTAAEFRAAVRAAAMTPFLSGAGDRGWRASFDWLIADPANVRKVLAGEYAPSDSDSRRTEKSRPERRGPADLYVGIAPRPADCGVRVNPAALERIRARQAGASADKSGPRWGLQEARAAPAALSASADK